MKKQSRKVGVAGGFINQLMGNNSTQPKVGAGATILMYSDRHAYEVIEVSENGNSCVIRAMHCEFVGSGYGDERYEYSSDEENHTKTLEWSNKQNRWGSVGYSVDIIKSLQNQLINDYSCDWYNNLPNGVNYSDLKDENDEDCLRLKVVAGITKKYKNFSKVSVIFGVMEEYRDPTF